MADGELRTVRFLDYNGDKRIDAMRSHDSGPNNVTQVFRNDGLGSFVLDPGAEPLGAGFESDSLELNDMNGDGLLDAVQITPTLVRYRLNLGWGRWEDWVHVVGFDFTAQEAVRAEVDDLNGDGVADLVLVAGNMVRYWLNRNGRAFDPERRVTSDDVRGELPVRGAETTVLHADMNGNGSSDIVWIDAQGLVTYLELFPVRPNLLSRITNGLGRVTEVAYGTSAQHMARTVEAGGSWEHRLPQPMNVVDTVDEWEELHPEVHTVMHYQYDDGRYDGIEKQFRGYAHAVQVEPPAGEDPEGRTVTTYNVGFDADGGYDPYLAGLVERQEMLSGGRTLTVRTPTWGDCALQGVPPEGLRFPVRHICRLAETTEIREGSDDPATWVTTEVRYSYDGYGNVALERDLGVVAVGGGACSACDDLGLYGRPCGPQCLGDEEYHATTYATPEDNGGLWMLRKPVVDRSYGRAGPDGAPADDNYAETITFYDGPPFQGLAQGRLSQGAVTRRSVRADAQGAVVHGGRYRVDEHGNVVEELDALGVPDGSDHRRVWSMDGAGLHVVQVDVFLQDERGPYVLRKVAQYDPLWTKPVEGTAWAVVVDGVVQGARRSNFYGYDEFGRLAWGTRPGEGAGQTSQEYVYDLRSPASRIIVRTRSQLAGDLDLEEIRCLDGRGREYQKRLRVEGQRYRVSGFTIFDYRSNVQEVFQPYDGLDDQCDREPPPGTLSLRSVFDAAGRIIAQRHPSVPDDGPGGPTEARSRFEPLVVERWDREDTRVGGEHAGTPTVLRRDGLGRLIAVERDPGGVQPLEVYRFAYDALGNVAAVIDPAGNVKRQQFDLLGQIRRVDDPDAGTTLFEYDAHGNLVWEQDARGLSVERLYDGTNRVLAEWQQGAEDETRIDYVYDRTEDCGPQRCSNVAGELVALRYPLGAGVRGEDEFGYTQRGHGSYTSRLLGGRRLETWAEHDNAGRLAATTYPNGLRVDYVLDGSARVRAIPGYLDEVVYDGRGDLSSVAMANGVRSERVYDERRRLAALNVTGPDGAALLAFTYGRDRQANVREVVDGRDDAGEPLGGARYDYDAVYRLTRAQLDLGRPPHEETLTMVHGPADLLLSQHSSRGRTSPAHVGDYRYGGAAGPHAVVQAGAVELGYDPRGNLTSRGDVAFEWDFLGRLRRATRAGEELVRYSYSGNGDRVVKREPGSTTFYAHPEFEVRNGVATVYVRVDGDRVVEIEDPSFAATFYSDLAPALGPDAALEPAPDGRISAGDAWVAAAVEGGALALAAGDPPAPSSVRDLLRASARRALDGLEGRTTYYHQDHLGGTAAGSDEQGALRERSEHYPFGAVRHQTGEAPSYGFAGKELDASVGLVHFGARYQDPWLGRWTAPDPLYGVVDASKLETVAEAASAYAYCGNSPVSARDHDGRAGIVEGALETLQSEAVMYASIGGASLGMLVSVVGSVQAHRARGDKVSVGKSIASGLKGAAMGGLSFGLSSITSARAYHHEAVIGRQAANFTVTVGGKDVRFFSPERTRVLAEKAHQSVSAQTGTTAFKQAAGVAISTAVTGGLAPSGLVTAPLSAAYARAQMRSLDKHGKTWAQRATSALGRGVRATPGAIGRGAKAVFARGRWAGGRAIKKVGSGLKGLGRRIQRAMPKRKKRSHLLLPRPGGAPPALRRPLWQDVEHPCSNEQRHELRHVYA